LNFGGTTMWCSTCHQDVPGIKHPTNGRTLCAQCQRPLRAPKPAYATKICDEGLALDDPAAKMAAATAPVSDFDQRARERARILNRELRRSGVGAVTPKWEGPRRFDAPKNLFADAALDRLPAVSPIVCEPKPLAARNRQKEGGQLLTWLIVVAGLAMLGGGVGLLTWSLAENALRYWNLGLGLALGGQGILIVGLMLAVARLWRSSRGAWNRLHDVHTRLGELQHTADALAGSRQVSGAAFYADLVRGASPQVLLANLKGQVDQLATRLGSGL
jgi:hypothetical protein